jgi:hypothetical protein
MSKKMKKKKMRYAKLGDFKTPSRILYEGTVKGYKVSIVNVCGRHPSAYIQIPEDLADIAFELLPVHGNCSFNEKIFFNGKKEDKGYRWVGWDYGHLCDYTPPLSKSQLDFYNSFGGDIRPRHTTEEVYNDIIRAVKELRYINQAKSDFYFEVNIDKAKDDDYYWDDLREWFRSLKAASTSPINGWHNLWLKGLSSVGFNTLNQQIKEIDYVISIINMAKNGELKITSED